MDAVLSRKERKSLCKLLELPDHCFGNVPMMKAYYKKVCLKLHPDKGGDPLKMMELNSLWGKFKKNVLHLRREVFEVSEPFFWEEDFPTLADQIANGYKVKFHRGPSCLLKAPMLSLCNCICCMLHRQHHRYKQIQNKKCMVWGSCFCYSCYCLWFGFPDSWESFDWWCKLIENTEFRVLNLPLY